MFLVYLSLPFLIFKRLCVINLKHVKDITYLVNNFSHRIKTKRTSKYLLCPSQILVSVEISSHIFRSTLVFFYNILIENLYNPFSVCICVCVFSFHFICLELSLQYQPNLYKKKKKIKSLESARIACFTWRIWWPQPQLYMTVQKTIVAGGDHLHL